MFNSWGQELKVGSVVYRGARHGNSSEYKVGVVESLKPGKPPRINWKFEATGRWIRIGGQQVFVPCIYSIKSSGSPSVDGLVVIDFDLDELNRRSEFFKSINGVEFFSLQEFNIALATFQV